MAGALQLIARLQAAPVPPVPPCKNSGEPLEAAPLLEVPPVPPVPPQKHETRKQCASVEPDPKCQERHSVPEHTGTSTEPTAWIAARDAFHRHALGKCPDCYPPLGRYCITGADLRAIYDRTPWS